MVYRSTNSRQCGEQTNQEIGGKGRIQANHVVADDDQQKRKDQLQWHFHQDFAKVVRMKGVVAGAVLAEKDILLHGEYCQHALTGSKELVYGDEEEHTCFVLNLLRRCPAVDVDVDQAEDDTNEDTLEEFD